MQEADVFIPAAIPNVIDATVAPRLQVRLVAEGANNAVAPQVARYARRRGRWAVTGGGAPQRRRGSPLPLRHRTG